MFVKRGILDFFDKRIQEETFDRPKLDGVASNKLEGEEGTDADAPVPVSTDEVSFVGQALHTFLAWPTHLVNSLSQQVLIVLTICFLFLN